ncbi:MAG: hypothetical protein ICV77_01820 [Cyanobacteria bacterium Co-bin8]|nr:hypothetical protein [Cyanobacteria bacterium Co-bin8]
MPIPQLDEFRRQYPTACLRTDLLAIHDNQYVVRAQVWVEGALLASAMAADPVLETAEDRACLRTLQCLSLPNSRLEADSAELSPEPAVSSSATPFPAPGLIEANGETGLQPAWTAPSPTLTPALVEVPPLPLPEKAALPLLSMTETAPWANSSAPTPELDLEPLTQPKPALPPRPDRPLPNEPTAGQRIGTASPVDLSDIIAQTDVELRRLGWTVGQGREFLERTYGKRSRHDLTDQELLEFLLFLETQPSPIER